MSEMVKRPWKAGVLLIAVFLAGALVGGVVARLRPPMMQGRDANGMLKHMTEMLDLTPVQRGSSAIAPRWTRRGRKCGPGLKPSAPASVRTSRCCSRPSSAPSTKR